MWCCRGITCGISDHGNSADADADADADDGNDADDELVKSQDTVALNNNQCNPESYPYFFLKKYSGSRIVPTFFSKKYSGSRINDFSPSHFITGGRIQN